MKQTESYDRLEKARIRPSAQRVAIMDYLLTHFTHPTVEDVYKGLIGKIPTLSRTTVYNTLRLFSERHAAQMITIDDHRVCYDGDIHPHVHFFCKECGKVYDLKDEKVPHLAHPKAIGHIIEEEQLYYKGICQECAKKKHNKKLTL